ncbi:hypothetical protein R1flu_020631 [Riccia fluitans]|uniref:Uncharacterized protein n=1 Tax=Riccia fluitans TaxID=41844 RepID=A0ABD1ZM98_9MARC
MEGNGVPYSFIHRGYGSGGCIGRIRSNENGTRNKQQVTVQMAVVPSSSEKQKVMREVGVRCCWDLLEPQPIRSTALSVEISRSRQRQPMLLLPPAAPPLHACQNSFAWHQQYDEVGTGLRPG